MSLLYYQPHICVLVNGKSKRQVTGLSHDSDPKVLAEGG